MRISKIHHVAYRCNGAKETVDWSFAAIERTQFC